ncbi:type I-B CRISPR-associated protein Cas7/Csh2 [Thermovirga lienii]|uniref:type I-B CRISPR-associated protein Cas7/Csh2 n=1 Tax=Thermovirga lienii TaxID=336261 RepID=UPI002FE41955
MGFKKRRELLFVYSVEDANPNGDPRRNNMPRQDLNTGILRVEDVRIKRTIRDQFIRDGHHVFINGEPITLDQRVRSLRGELSLQLGKNVEATEDILGACIDTRLFGVVYASGSKNHMSWTGPVQWMRGYSLHRVYIENIEGTAAFASREGNEQRSFRSEYIVPFALIASYAIANQYVAETTGATSEDLDAHFDAVWTGHENLISRSKIGHMPRLLLEVTYKEGYNSLIGMMHRKVFIHKRDDSGFTAEEEICLRSLSDVVLNITPLAEKIVAKKDVIDRIRVRKDEDLMIKGLEQIQENIGERFELEVR